MLSQIANLARSRQKLLTYVAIGILGLWVDLGGFYLLFNVFHLDKSLANLISSAAAIFHNFVLNALFNFKKRDKLPARLLSFYAIGIVGIGITQVLFWIFSDGLGITANVVKPIAVVVVFIVQYNLNKWLSFR